MIWKCKKCQMVLEVASPLRFCPNCGEKTDLSDPVRLLKWNEEEAKPAQPLPEELPRPSQAWHSVPSPENTESPQTQAPPQIRQEPLLDNSLEPPPLRLHTPTVAPPPLPSPAPLESPMAQPAVKKNHVSYRECPFCGSPLKEESDICDICGKKYDDPTSWNGNPLAGPWQRWAARYLDYNLEFICLAVALYLLVTMLVLASRHLCVTLFSEEAATKFLAFMLGFNLRTTFLFSPFIFLLDSIEYAVFGNTLGKWLFDVKVRDVNARPLTPGAYFMRNLRVYWGGYGLCIPIVTLFTMYTQYKFVSRGLSTTYDHRLGYTSISHNESNEKTILGILILVVLFFLPLIKVFC